jgi:thiamine pyrophosphate-dependent acetolactate synthase large subunit-like protein
VIQATSPDSAALMAGVTGVLADVPGAVLLDELTWARNGLAFAFGSRAPVIVVTTGPMQASWSPRPGSGTTPDAAAWSCKSSLVVEPASAGHWIAHAAQLAMNAPRGPVHLAVPAAVAAMAALPVAASCRPATLPAPDKSDLDAAAEQLRGAGRPVVIAGVECRAPGVGPWLRAFAESLPAPVLATLAAKGALPDPHPLLLGLVAGPGEAHPVLELADLVVAVGVDPGEAVPAIASGVPWLRLGITPWPDPARGRTDAPGLAVDGRSVTGDVVAILEEMAPRLRDRGRIDWDVARLDRLKRENVRTTASTSERTVVDVVQRVREMTPAGALAVSNARYATAAIAHWQSVAPGELLTPTGSHVHPSAAPGSGGFLVSAAIAAALARPGRQVLGFGDERDLDIAGQEMLAERGQSVVLVVLDHGSSAACPTASPAQPGSGRAEAAGPVQRVPVANERELTSALTRGLETRGPLVIDARGMTARAAAVP